MAKDAKGHGSNKRGANTLDSVYSSKAGVGRHGPGMYARTASGAQYKLNPAATEGRIPRVGSDIDPSQHTTVMDKAVAKSLAGGHPKSGTPPVHSGATGPSDRAFGHLSHGEAFRFSSERDHPFSGMAKGPWTKTSPRGYTHAESGGKYRVGSIKAKTMKP